jgi:hypothetical protein
MFAPLPFALHATAGCPPHAELALSLAWAFGDVDSAALDAELDRRVERLPEPASEHPLAELRALSGIGRVANVPGVVATDGLLLPTAVKSKAPHPLARAIIGAELARRRGFAVGIVSNGTHHCLAHTELAVPLLLRADTGEVVDAQGLPPALTWRCAHETCGLLLDELERRWLAEGRLDRALTAAELRLHLPFDEDGMRRAELRLRQTRALLN